MPLAQPDALAQRFGHEWASAVDSMELAGRLAYVGPRCVLAGRQTPVFFGSGVNNFGVMEVLDALVDLAPSPRPLHQHRHAQKQTVVQQMQPEDAAFSGVVFRCRPTWTPTTATALPLCAWPRVATARHEAQGHAQCQRAAPTSVVTFLSQRREAVDEAYAGDIIGFTTHGGVQLGDTITDGSVPLQYTGLPFSPRDVHDGGAEKPAAHQTAPAGLAQLGRRRDPGVSAPRWAAICCSARWGSCSLRWCSTA